MMLGFLLAFAGAVLLSLSMKKHFRQLFPDRVLTTTTSNVLRSGGYLLLSAAFWAGADVKGVGLGLTWFAGQLTVAFFSIALLLPLIDRRTR